MLLRVREMRASLHRHAIPGAGRSWRSGAARVCASRQHIIESGETAVQQERIFKALAREGLHVEKRDLVYRVRLPDVPDAPVAEVLLPEGFALEKKALAQLAGFASARHPGGGRVCAAFATPDFHPGTLVPVGARVRAMMPSP